MFNCDTAFDLKEKILGIQDLQKILPFSVIELELEKDLINIYDLENHKICSFKITNEDPFLFMKKKF
jgi:hypothetical protein